jgi:UDP-N-acetyl-D-mannosaminuronic acid dehydrogenase
MDFQKICILGLGYIGLPTASMFAASAIKVIGVDVNEEIVSTLKRGDLHIHEPGLREFVDCAFQSGRLVVQVLPEEADAFIIAVPTPFCDGKKADLRFVESAASMIVPYLKSGNLVVLESTSPPQTTTNILVPILEKSGLKAGKDFYVVYSPERVLPGSILKELIENDRVIGGIDQASAEVGRDLYRLFVKGRIVLTDSTTAEMVKLMENTYRDVNIAIANEFLRLADRFGVNIWNAIEIANLHPRVKILKPGIGVGGHCISVDPWFLVEAAPEITPLIRAARTVNDSQPGFLVQYVQSTVGCLGGKRIAILGLSYKADVDDIRESPAIELAHLLHKEGCVVNCYEPFRASGIYEGVSNLGGLEETIKDADVIILAVAHKQFLDLDPADITGISSARLLIDAVDGIKEGVWKEAGFCVHKFGTYDLGMEMTRKKLNG